MYYARRVNFFFTFVNLKKLNRPWHYGCKMCTMSGKSNNGNNAFIRKSVYFGEKNVVTRLLEFDIVTIARVEPSLF